MRSALHLIILIWLPWISLFSRAADDLNDFGPIYDRFRLTLNPGERTEILGPLVSLERAGSESTEAFSPLLSLHRDSGADAAEFDFLYPILTYDRFGLEYRFQLFQFFSFSGGGTTDAGDTHRFTLFPFYFQQRSSDPAQNYTAVMPFYGHLKNRFFRDEIFFVMLPFYIQSRKKDVITDNYLMPFFDRRRGDGLKGWQFWPVMGQEHKDVTTRTNLYQETETVGGHDKLFVLWPFFFKNDLETGTTNLQTQRLLLPFYSIQHSPLRDTSTFLWPFGYTQTEDRERKYREWALPWPFIDFARGEGKTLNRIWPLFSKGKTATVESDFYLWPIYKYNRVTSEPLDRERTRIFFFLYSDLIERNTTAGTALHRTDLWPLFTARRDHQGNERLQLLAPLESLLPSNPGIERNYAPIWSLWRSEKNAKTGATSQSLLWNLFRHEADPTHKKFSLLFGLFHYQSGPDGKRWRVFYIPLGRPSRVATTASTLP